MTKTTDRGHTFVAVFAVIAWAVLCALAVEHGTKLVARRLMLSPETVKHHLKNIYAKLDVRTRDEALAEARRRALMP